MNRNLGLIGRKLGNTQIFAEDGRVTRVTAIEAGPCVVLAKRTEDKHGYTALQLGFGKGKKKRLAKAQLGTYEKLGVEPARVVREFRVPAEVVDKYEVGQSLSAADVFEEGQTVDVCGVTKGRGFSGVLRRWNFKGSGSVTHGCHEYERHGGSIGQNMTPGHTLANQKMCGHYGAENLSVINLKVARILADKNIVLISGSVPGPRSGVVTVRGGVKARAKKTETAAAAAG